VCDPDEARRKALVAYWGAQLPKSTAGRLVACFEMLYTPSVEAIWLHCSVVLLLQVCPH